MSKTSPNNKQVRVDGYTCEICSLILPRLHSLRVHLRDVHQENAFQCDICSEKLPSRSLLKSHVKKHSTENAKADTTLPKEHANLQRKYPTKRKHPHVHPVKNVLKNFQKYVLKDPSRGQSNSKHKKDEVQVISSMPSSCIVTENDQLEFPEEYDRSKPSVLSHPEAENEMICVPQEYLLMEYKQERDTDSFLEGDCNNVANFSDTEVSNNNGISANSISFNASPEPSKEQNVTEIVEVLKVEVNHEELGNVSRPPELHVESRNIAAIRNETENLLNTDQEPDPDSLLICSLCDKSFPDNIALATHESLHDSQPLSDGEEHESDERLDLHLGVESHDYLSKLKGTGEFTCDKCPISFPRQHMLKMHASKIHGDNPFECLICGEKCPTRRSLTKHKQVHVVDGAFKCETCGVSQAKYSNFLRHLKLHSGTRDYTCEWCGQSFTTSTVLIRHRRRHTGEKPYSCDQCGERFARLYGLKVHQSKHAGRSYFCAEENCSKGFYSKSALNNHMKSHLPERPFKCVACGCGFYMSSHYKDHLRKHTGEKPFVCEVCTKTFARKAELVVHIRVHTGERPFVCSHCNKAFISLTALKHHSKTHTKNRENKCTECEQVFTSKLALKRHIKCAHNASSSDLSEEDSFSLWLSEDEDEDIDSPDSFTEGIDDDHDKCLDSEKCEASEKL